MEERQYSKTTCITLSRGQITVRDSHDIRILSRLSVPNFILKWPPYWSRSVWIMRSMIIILLCAWPSFIGCTAYADSVMNWFFGYRYPTGKGFGSWNRSGGNAYGISDDRKILNFQFLGKIQEVPKNAAAPVHALAPIISPYLVWTMTCSVESRSSSCRFEIPIMSRQICLDTGGEGNIVIHGVPSYSWS